MFKSIEERRKEKGLSSNWLEIYNFYLKGKKKHLKQKLNHAKSSIKPKRKRG
jgi:hypothetical protein